MAAWEIRLIGNNRLSNILKKKSFAFQHLSISEIIRKTTTKFKKGLAISRKILYNKA
jgi:hypothetical protein